MFPAAEAVTASIRRKAVDLMPIERDPRQAAMHALANNERSRPTDALDKKFTAYDLRQLSLPVFDERLRRMVPAMAAFDLEDPSATCYVIRSQTYSRLRCVADRCAVGPQVLASEIDGPEGEAWTFPFSDLYRRATATHRAFASDLANELGRMMLALAAVGVAGAVVVWKTAIPPWWIAVMAGIVALIWILVRLVHAEWNGATYHTYLHARFRGAIPDELRARILLERPNFDRVFLLADVKRWSIDPVDTSELGQITVVGYRRTAAGDRYWTLATFTPELLALWQERHGLGSAARTAVSTVSTISTSAPTAAAPAMGPVKSEESGDEFAPQDVPRAT